MSCLSDLLDVGTAQGAIVSILEEDLTFVKVDVACLRLHPQLLWNNLVVINSDILILSDSL
jgi:hypothetical protein